MWVWGRNIVITKGFTKDAESLVSQCTSLSRGNRSQDDKGCGLGSQSGLGAELCGLQFLRCVLWG